MVVVVIVMVVSGVCWCWWCGGSCDGGDVSVSDSEGDCNIIVGVCWYFCRKYSFTLYSGSPGVPSRRINLSMKLWKRKQSATFIRS